MRQHLPNIAIFVVLAGAITTGWWYVDKTYFPKPQPKQPEPPTPPKELVGSLTGSALLAAPPVDTYASLPPPPPVRLDDLRMAVAGGTPVAVRLAKVLTPPKPTAPAEPPELIALGDNSFFKRVLLTTKGGAIQQVVLNNFEEANQLGLAVQQANGTPQPLRIIPGVRPPKVSLTEVHKHPHADLLPTLAPGRVPADLLPELAEPSYVLLHYPSEDDPRREPDSAERMNDNHPSPELGERTWTVVERHQPADGGEWRVTFETTLGAPYFLKLRKTYTLAPADYHVGLRLDIEPLPGRVRDKGKFRYQIAGPRHVHLEGEWYTSTYRNVMVGWLTPSGGAKRTIEDALSIHHAAGGAKVARGSNTFTYAAVGTQYLASALAIDNDQPQPVKNDTWDYVRPTREPGPDDDPNQLFLADVTFRAVSPPLEVEPGQPRSYRYLIYDGPIKVRLLGHADKEKGRPAIDDSLLYRYMDDLTLRTMTDFHSPNFFGRLANAIWWSDLVITFTNLMHEVLGFLHRIVPVWGLDIMLLTVMVRLILLLPSRKQQIMMARMQEKMAKMKPELDKLQEKYKDNPQLLQQEKTRLMFQHGVNPLSTMGGCLMLFAQMPVFMGLYFCLQESVFFRLDPFLWCPNLTAPDMLVWWGEGIPYISSPDHLGGTLYLGPYFNILPIVAVALIFAQQWLTMPPPTDEQQEMQQRMMKIMLAVMAVMFYKVPAGLCLYFICSTSWALAERKLIPKPKAVTAAAAAAAGGDGPNPPTGGRPVGPKPPEPPGNGAQGGGFMARWKAKLEEMQRQADEQARRQIRKEPPGRGGPPGGGKKKRKK